MIKESVEQNGQKPELFGEIVRTAVLLLELLIMKAMQKVMNIAEKVIGNAVDGVKEISKETESPIRAEDAPAVQSERKRIPFPINPCRKLNMQKNT